MVDESTHRPYRDRMASIVNDPEFDILDNKYLPYLQLHGIEEIFSVFDVVQAPPEDPITGKLIWHPEYGLPL